MTIEMKSGRPAAALVGVQLPGISDEEHAASLAELERLCDTLGFQVVARLSQKRARLSPAAGVGPGKLRELAQLTGGTGIIPSGARQKVQRKDLRKQDDDDDDDDVDDEPASEAVEGDPPASGVRVTTVVVDNELGPSQLRNLERATGVEVLDRAGVIIEIFHRHAHTREAKLQVEIARLTYEAPRLREKEHTGDRQRGGGVGGKGDDELELDRRRIRDRIAELRRELEQVQADEQTRRQRRKDQQKVALVGYTNAGKSSLMRALTGSEVLVADKLFATLGTTVRQLVPPTHPRILVSDTVGFIKNLPHGLVASFRSTLEEAHEASLLLHVVDSSDPAFRAQWTVTRDVLREIEADRIPARLVLNKVDRLAPDDVERLRAEFPDAIFLSAFARDDVARLREAIVAFFEAGMEERRLHVPYAAQAVLGSIRESARVVAEEWDEEGVRLLLRADPATFARFAAWLV